MSTAVTAVRLLLGLAFTVFGLNAFLHFIPQPEAPADAQAFIGALNDGLFYQAAHLAQLVAGLLLLANRAVPLALVMLTPVLIGVVLFHLVFEPAGGVPGYVMTALLGFLLWAYRASFLPLLSGRPLADRPARV